MPDQPEAMDFNVLGNTMQNMKGIADALRQILEPGMRRHVHPAVIAKAEAVLQTIDDAILEWCKTQEELKNA